MIILDSNNIQIEVLKIEIENTGHITNTYIVKDNDSKKALVIDPAFNEELIKEHLEDFILESVIVTHSHADHIAALANLTENTDVKVYVHRLDLDGLYDKTLNEEDIVQTKVLPVDKTKVICVEENDKIQFENLEFEVIHTPGHTKGSMVIYNEENNMLFSGDTLFENTYGRTDLITGSTEDMGKTLDKLFNRFDDVEVLSGHGNIFNLKDSKRKIKLLFAYKG